MVSDSIVEFLKTGGFCQKSEIVQNGIAYYTREALVAKHGRAFNKIIPRPAGMRKGRDGYCYKNAYDVMRKYPGEYYYCEGFAASANSTFYCLHAWVINKDCEVVDPTWKAGGTYFGVVFKFSHVMQSMAKVGRFQGVLDGLYYSENFSLLRKTSGAFRKIILNPDKLPRSNF